MAIRSIERFLGNLVGPRQETIDRVLAASSRSSSAEIWWETFAKEALSIPPGIGDTYEPSSQRAKSRRGWRRIFLGGYTILAATLVPIVPLVGVGMLVAETARFATNPSRAINTANAAVEQVRRRRSTPQ